MVPPPNKMGGIWDVIDAESKTMAGLAAKERSTRTSRILVAGPYYPTPGSDWNRGKNRVTDISGYEKLNMGPEMEPILSTLTSAGIETVPPRRGCRRPSRLRPLQYHLLPSRTLY